jgi:hypothetical protein
MNHQKYQEFMDRAMLAECIDFSRLDCLPTAVKPQAVIPLTQDEPIPGSDDLEGK